MTDEEINIAIAKACGWKFIPEYCHGEDQPPEFTTVTPDGKHLCGYYPDYCQDLNAIHEAEKMLQHYGVFVDELANVMRQPRQGIMLCHATAAQRAEAFLKTLFLWNPIK